MKVCTGCGCGGSRGCCCLYRAQMGTTLTHICNLAVNPRPKDTIARMLSGELDTMGSSIWLLKYSWMSRERNSDMLFFKQKTIT